MQTYSLLASSNMWKITVLIFVSVMFLQPSLSPSSFAFAKRRFSPRAYSFIVEGGKASQAECDGERKIPRRLKRHNEYRRVSQYMGSELLTSEIPGKGDGDLVKHFFRAKSVCNSLLDKAPSALTENLKVAKPELPSDDSLETNDEPEDSSENNEAPAAAAPAPEPAT